MGIREEERRLEEQEGVLFREREEVEFLLRIMLHMRGSVEVLLQQLEEEEFLREVVLLLGGKED